MRDSRIFVLLLTCCCIASGIRAQEEANLLGTWNNPELIGSNFYNNIYNEIWGLSVNDREFAVIGSTAGTHIIDVTDPAAAEEVVFIAGAAQGGAIIHRDFHDYGNYLYAVSDESASSLQIIDISALPDSATIVYDSNLQIRRAHNIFIDSTNALLYAFATNSPLMGSFALRIFDISDPVAPVFIAEHKKFGPLNAGHVHDGYVRDNIAFLHCGSDGFAIVDFTDPEDPETLSTIRSYPQQGYNHSGWLTDDATTYYMADENHNFDLKVIDVTDPCTPQVTGTFDAGLSNSLAITHNQIAACGYLYTSYYYDGLQVFDISDPENPQKVLYYDTYAEGNGASYKGAWGIYPFLPSGNILLSDMQNGLFVFEGMDDGCGVNPAKEPVNASCEVPTLTSDDLTGPKFSVYPQPASAGQSVRVKGLESGKRLRLYLYTGNGVSIQTLETDANFDGIAAFRLDEALATGIYFLRVENSSGSGAVMPLQIY